MLSRVIAKTSGMFFLRHSVDCKSALLLQRGQFGPRLELEGVALRQPFLLSEIDDKRSFMWYKIMGISFFRFVTIHAFGRRTDGHFAYGHIVRCITCSRTVKTICLSPDNIGNPGRQCRILADKITTKLEKKSSQLAIYSHSRPCVEPTPL